MKTTIASFLRLALVSVAIGLSFVAVNLAARTCIVSAGGFDVRHMGYGDTMRIQGLSREHAAKIVAEKRA